MEKSCAHSSAFTIGRIFFILADNEDNHTISDEFEYGPDPTTDCVELSVLVHLKKSHKYLLIMGKIFFPL